MPHTRFYIAGAFSQWEKLSRIRDDLIAAGGECTYDWMSDAKSGKSPPNVGELELDGVRNADVVYVFLEWTGLRERWSTDQRTVTLTAPELQRGTHVELGAALALGKRVYIHSPDSSFHTQVPFYTVSGVRVLWRVESAATVLSDWSNRHHPVWANKTTPDAERERNAIVAYIDRLAHARDDVAVSYALLDIIDGIREGYHLAPKPRTEGESP